MAENTEISWTTHTANLWWGCAKVHAGCDHCYAETLSHRWGQEVWGPKAPRRAIKAVWKDLARFQREAAKAGRVDRVFVGSMMDIFEKPFPLIDSESNSLPETTGHMRQRFFEEVVPACPNLLFLLLTKRPSNILKYIPESWKLTPPANVMYGTSVVNQETADSMIPELLKVPGRRFLSMEPLLGPVTFKGRATCGGETDRWNYLTGWESTWNAQPRPGHPHDLGAGYSSSGIQWVIVGGESGNGARPMHPDWVRKIHTECINANVPFHFKQWGEFAPVAYVNGLGDAGYEGTLNGQPETLEWSGAAKKVVEVPEFVADWYAHGEGDGPVKDYPFNKTRMLNVGKKLAGNHLNRKLYQDVPTI